MVASGACGGGAARRGRTVVFASGAELQSMNPLVTIHPLAKQVQRYVLLTTLARYDTALVPRPYLARAWVWSPDLQALRFRLQSGVHWHDGTPTTARDVVWTLNAARDPATGYPRLNDLAAVSWVFVTVIMYCEYNRVVAAKDRDFSLIKAAPAAPFVLTPNSCRKLAGTASSLRGGCCKP